MLRHPREDWVQRARAQAVSVPTQFFEHPESIHTVLISVMEDVNLPERQKKFALDRIAHLARILRHSARDTALDPRRAVVYQ